MADRRAAAPVGRPDPAGTPDVAGPPDPAGPPGDAFPAVPWVVNCSIVLADLPLLERPAAAAAAGFAAVELWWPFATAAPGDREVDALVRAVEDAGVRLTALNLAAGDMAAGDRGLVSLPGREAELRDSVAVVAGIADRLGTRQFNALYGNRLDGVDPAAQDDLAVANLAAAARALAPVGGTLLVEPVSGADRYPLRTAADALGVVDRVAAETGETAVGLLADLYHLAVNGDDVDAVVTGQAGRVAHVQVADAPGRGEPGSGALPLARWLAALVDGGYAGRVALEHRATGPDPFAWLPRERRGGPAPRPGGSA